MVSENEVKQDDVFEPKPQWLSKTNWGVVVAVASVVLGYFGLSTEWLDSLAKSAGVTPVALTATFMAILNVVLKVGTWAYYKWIVKKED